MTRPSRRQRDFDRHVDEVLQIVADDPIPYVLTEPPVDELRQRREAKR